MDSKPSPQGLKDMTPRTLVILAITVHSAFVWAQESTTQPAGPASAPAAPATAPAAPGPQTLPAPPEEVKRRLENLEKAGAKYAAIQAKVQYQVDMAMTGDTEQRTGWVAYQQETAQTPAKFRVQFETLRLGEGKTINDRVDYAFDGEWLTVAKHRIKQMTRYQVATKGEKVDPLKLGRGPFPLPFGQKTGQMIRFFEASARPSTPDDPKDTDYLKLTTRKEFKKDINFTQLEMWIERATNLPVKLVSKDDKKNVTTLVFTDIQTDKKLSDDMFLLPRPLGWSLSIEKLETGQALTP